MWTKHPDTKQWTRQNESLPRQDYDLLKQELEKTRYYSKCLHGTTYLPINRLDDVYDILNYTDESGWYIGAGSSIYASPIASQAYEVEINSTSKSEFDKYVSEYGHTLKNLFTPEKIIEESVNNYVYVDLSTTEEIIDGITGIKINLMIDGIKVLEGHRILVKNQRTYITLSNSIDPSTYFTNNYYVNIVDTINTEYYYYNNDNGIYLFKENQLVRESDLDLYNDCVRYSIACKMGTVNRDKQWHLSRLLNGYYPLYLNGDNIEFIEKHNWLLRNKVDYNNVLDINYYDIVRYDAELIKILGYTYSIPERSIAVGEFGVIVNTQGNIPNIIQNRYKANLRSISSTNNYYWFCGDDGTLLKVSKLTLLVEKININTINNLYSVNFFNNLRGLVVGDYNTIFETIDGGLTWLPIIIDEFEGFKYNKVLYHNFNKAYIGGDSGVYLELELVNSEWTVYKRTIKKILDSDDEFELIDNINDMIYHKWDLTNIWSLTWSGTASYGTISTTKEAIILVTNRDNLIVHNINDFITQDYLYLDYKKSIGDLKSISSHSASLYFNSKDDVYKVDLSQFPIVGSVSNIIDIVGTVSTVYTTPLINTNKLFDYNELALQTAGDNSQLYSATYSIGITQSILTNDFFDGLKSKLLFLDYEIASKLNFFDDNQKYRLPSSISFTASGITFSNITNEYNWLSYYKDSIKTWEYYAFGVLSGPSGLVDSNKIEFSTNFRYATMSQGLISMTSSSMTIDIVDIKSLAPSIDQYHLSRFLSGSVSISAPSMTYSIYAANNILIIASDTLSASVGDMLLLDSLVIKSTFMINKIVTFGLINYYYCYSNLDPVILNELKSSSSNIEITNLNTWYDNQTFVDRFNQHPIGIGYIATTLSNKISINALFNNYTAYYNMSTTAVTNTDSYDMVYQKSFLNFGFKPTYDLFNYLYNINPVSFTASKQFNALPRYNNIPFSDLSMGTASFDGIYFDSNVGTNKLYFSPSIKKEWDSFFEWTFLDVDIKYTSSTYSTTKLLLMDKYYDSTLDWYVLEFHKKLDYITGTTMSSFNVLSRNRLDEISHDLEEMNNIQRTKSYSNYNVKFGQDDNGFTPNSWQFSNLQGELNFKFPTDSYAQVFTADHDIKDNISAIVYIDNKNYLALNTVKLTKEIKANINYFSQDSFGYLIINTTDEHKLEQFDGFLLILNDIVGSSYYLNPQYNGYLTVKSIIDKYTIVVDILAGVAAVVDSGVISHFKKDPFLNYQPVDIIDVGIDKKSKKSVAILQDNIILQGSTYKLVNLDLSKFKFSLVDGLNLDIITKKYSWILEAEIDNAIIGEDVNGLVWYTGIWYCGRWFGGTWYSGQWLGGDWYDGIWDSVKIENKILFVKVDSIVKDRKYSTWRSGKWYKGEWKLGTWYNGSWYSGKWNDGEWFNGIWNDGSWIDGSFIGGTWVQGIWYDGNFSGKNKPAYWIDGKWYGGDFENGYWYNGTWTQNSGKISRFGTNPTNSKPAIWHGGEWFAGQFHSVLNLDSNGNPSVSDRHSYSVWNTGTWLGGDFYGGVAYHMDMRNGKWWGGIMEELPIYGIISSSASNAIQLKGEWRFNNLDNIWITDNYTNTGSLLGTNQEPKLYKVRDIDLDYSTPEKMTTVYVFYQDNTIPLPVTSLTYSTTASGYRVVSHLSKSKWYSGIWENGILQESEFWGGIWYNGVVDNSKWDT